jgi:hypothetical protein
LAGVVAYIDGFNLYFGLKCKYGRRYLWLDLVELVRQLRPGDQMLVVRYFTAVAKGEPAAAANQIDYIDALQAHCGPTLDVQRGWFKPRKIAPCRMCGGRPGVSLIASRPACRGWRRLELESGGLARSPNVYATALWYALVAHANTNTVTGAMTANARPTA